MLTKLWLKTKDLLASLFAGAVLAVLGYALVRKRREPQSHIDYKKELQEIDKLHPQEVPDDQEEIIRELNRRGYTK